MSLWSSYRRVVWSTLQVSLEQKNLEIKKLQSQAHYTLENLHITKQGTWMEDDFPFQLGDFLGSSRSFSGFFSQLVPVWSETYNSHPEHWSVLNQLLKPHLSLHLNPQPTSTKIWNIISPNIPIINHFFTETIPTETKHPIHTISSLKFR